MGVVVLDGDQLDARRARARTGSTGSRGAGRGRRPRGATANSRSKWATPSLKGAQCRVVLEVADVVADPRAFALGQAERVLLLGAAGQQRPRGGDRAAPASRARTRASGAASAPAPVGAGDRAHDGVVGAGLDRPVVEQEQIGDRAPGARARRRRGRRSARRRRCRWSSPAARARRVSRQQQVVQRRCRGASRRARARPAPPTAPPAALARRRAGEHDRPRRRLAAASRSAGPSIDQRAAPRPTSATISANGLSSRCLRARSAATAGSSSARQARWIAADALDRDDRARAQARGRRARTASRAEPRAVLGRPARVARAAGVGPQSRARVGLGVEAPVERDPRTRRGTRRTSRSRPSSSAAGRRGRRVTIVKRGPAVGAVDERVAVAPVGRVAQLGQAVRAGRGVGGDRRVGGPAAGARLSRIAKAALARRRRPAPRVDRSTDASGGASRAQRARGTRRSPAPAPSTSSSTPWLVVEHAADSASSASQPVHEGAEADALDRAGHPHADAQSSPGAGERAHRDAARAARGRRSPAPPGSAGCAASG